MDAESPLARLGSRNEPDLSVLGRRSFLEAHDAAPVEPSKSPSVNREAKQGFPGDATTRPQAGRTVLKALPVHDEYQVTRSTFGTEVFKEKDKERNSSMSTSSRRNLEPTRQIIRTDTSAMEYQASSARKRQIDLPKAQRKHLRDDRQSSIPKRNKTAPVPKELATEQWSKEELHDESGFKYNKLLMRCLWEDCNDQHLQCLQDLLNHILTDHIPHKYGLCAWCYCAHSYGDRVTGIEHVWTNHLSNQPVRCAMSGCKQVFRTLSKLHDHILSEHTASIDDKEVEGGNDIACPATGAFHYTLTQDYSGPEDEIRSLLLSRLGDRERGKSFAFDGQHSPL